MPFSTIHTDAGLAAMSAAEAAGASINLTQMAVGDGNGNPVTPNSGQTALYREMYRAAINRVFRPDPNGEPARYAAELVVPASVGGFTMREVGVFTEDGTLFVVGNLPDTYKPEASEGSFADSVVRVEFIATNADLVTIQMDPNVTVATREWVTNNVSAGNVIPGGTTGQVLTKQSNADGDTYWNDPTDANVVVDTIEEYQTLAAGQTVVTLATVTTAGLAVYIDGVRLREDASADGWQPGGADNTVLTLGQSYPAGTEITMVQNDPAAGFPDALLRDQNLADLPNKRMARAHLGVDPPGQVSFFARMTAPAGWLKANGAEISRTAYADLFDAIGTTFGAGNGVDTFNLPDLRGEFLRGWDDGRGIDPLRWFATAQGDELKSHRHGLVSPGGVQFFVMSDMNDPLPQVDIDDGGRARVQGPDDRNDAARFPWTGYVGGSETRPRNIALLACIKF